VATSHTSAMEKRSGNESEERNRERAREEEREGKKERVCVPHSHVNVIVDARNIEEERVIPGLPPH